jgi:hypothetical protein
VTGALGNCVQVGEVGVKPHRRVAYTLVHTRLQGQ